MGTVFSYRHLKIKLLSRVSIYLTFASIQKFKIYTQKPNTKLYLLFVSVMPFCTPVTQDRFVILFALSNNCLHFFLVFFWSLEGGKFYEKKKYFEHFCRTLINVLFILMLSLCSEKVKRTIGIFLEII